MEAWKWPLIVLAIGLAVLAALEIAARRNRPK